MEDLRLKKLELKVHEHNRRLDDHDSMHLNAEKRMIADRADIDMLKQIHETQKENNALVAEVVTIAKETLEIVRPLLKVVRFVGIAAAWSTKIAIGGAVIWHAIKWGATKIGLVWP